MESQISKAGLSFKDLDCLPIAFPVDGTASGDVLLNPLKICRIYCDVQTQTTVANSSDVTLAGANYSGPCCNINAAVDSRFQCIHPIPGPIPVPPVLPPPVTSPIPPGTVCPDLERVCPGGVASIHLPNSCNQICPPILVTPDQI